jgi:hypothetical protein
VPTGFAEACVALAAEGALSWTPSAAFEAAAELSCTAFMVVRVFWITLGLWAAASPEASTQIRIVFVGFIFIPSLPISSPGFRLSLAALPDPDRD